MNNIPKDTLVMKVTKLFKENIIKISIILGLIFFLFISFQIYSYFILQNIYKNSEAYFNSKDLDSNDDFVNIMNQLSKNQDFYSVLATLELIKINKKENNIILVEELYNNLLNNKKLKKEYLTAIAAHASYNFLDLMFENSDLTLNKIINGFIENIDEEMLSYQGIKLELKYLLLIAEQDINNISAINHGDYQDIYNSIIESENISNTIKDRVNKIHEFQLYK